MSSYIIQKYLTAKPVRFEVPDKLTSEVEIHLWGAGGGSGYLGAAGGPGGYVKVIATVAAGDIIEVNVGGHGEDGTATEGGLGGIGYFTSDFSGGQGGGRGDYCNNSKYNNEKGPFPGGGGGGASSVYINDVLVAVAGGGGGGSGRGHRHKDRNSNTGSAGGSVTGKNTNTTIGGFSETENAGGGGGGYLGGAAGDAFTEHHHRWVGGYGGTNYTTGANAISQAGSQTIPGGVGTSYYPGSNVAYPGYDGAIIFVFQKEQTWYYKDGGTWFPGTNLWVKARNRISLTQKTRRTSPGTTLFTVPSGVTALTVTLVGGGGGGGYSNRNFVIGGALSADQFGGGGGGSGGYIRETIQVKPGEVYNVTVGAGGSGASAGNTSSTAQNGGDSTFGSLLKATGGRAGGNPTYTPASTTTVPGGVPVTYIATSNGSTGYIQYLQHTSSLVNPSVTSTSIKVNGVAVSGSAYSRGALRYSNRSTFGFGIFGTVNLGLWNYYAIYDVIYTPPTSTVTTPASFNPGSGGRGGKTGGRNGSSGNRVTNTGIVSPGTSAGVAAGGRGADAPNGLGRGGAGGVGNSAGSNATGYGAGGGGAGVTHINNVTTMSAYGGGAGTGGLVEIEYSVPNAGFTDADWKRVKGIWTKVDGSWKFLNNTQDPTPIELSPPRITITFTISSSTSNWVLTQKMLKKKGYYPSRSDILVVIEPNVVVSSSSISKFALDIDVDIDSADSLTLINQGTIVGAGGKGADNTLFGASGGAGGDAIRISCPVIIDNQGTIAGGGGGGGAISESYVPNPSVYEYNTPGIYDFTVPVGTETINVTVAGAGGGGGGGGKDDHYNGYDGYPGAKLTGSLKVVPGQQYKIVVGEGGIAGNAVVGLGETPGGTGGYVATKLTTNQINPQGASLVGYWTVSSTNGNIVYDEINPSKQNLIRNTAGTNIATMPSKSIPSIYFNGSLNSYAIVENNTTELALTRTAGSSFTIEAWIYPTGPGSNVSWGGMIINHDSDFEVARLPDGRIICAFDWGVGTDIYLPGGGWIVPPVGTAIAPVNTATHVAVVVENTVLKIYLNGSLAWTKTGLNRVAKYTTASKTWIGSRPSANQRFVGYISDIRIWNVARSAGQISGNYNTYLQLKSWVVNSGNVRILDDDLFHSSEPIGSQAIAEFIDFDSSGNVLIVSNTAPIATGMFITANGFANTVFVTSVVNSSNVTLSSGNTGVISGNISFYTKPVVRTTSVDYSELLELYGVWDADTTATTFTRSYKVDFPEAGFYTFEASCDNSGNVQLDGTTVLNVNDYRKIYATTVYVSKGYHTVTENGTNRPGTTGSFALVIDSAFEGGLGGSAGPIIEVQTPYTKTETFTSPGTYQWAAPANVFTRYEATITVVGAGGGGGYSNKNYQTGNTNKWPDRYTAGRGGGGGGSGAYIKDSFTVVPGEIYTITVGSGGRGAAAVPGNLALDGTNSQIGITSTSVEFVSLTGNVLTVTDTSSITSGMYITGNGFIPSSVYVTSVEDSANLIISGANVSAISGNLIFNSSLILAQGGKAGKNADYANALPGTGGVSGGLGGSNGEAGQKRGGDARGGRGGSNPLGNGGRGGDNNEIGRDGDGYGSGGGGAGVDYHHRDWDTPLEAAFRGGKGADGYVSITYQYYTTTYVGGSAGSGGGGGAASAILINNTPVVVAGGGGGGGGAGKDSAGKPNDGRWGLKGYVYVGFDESSHTYLGSYPKETYTATVGNPVSQANGWYTRSAHLEKDPYATFIPGVSGVKQYYIRLNGVTVWDSTEEPPAMYKAGSYRGSASPSTYPWGLHDYANAFDLIITDYHWNKGEVTWYDGKTVRWTRAGLRGYWKYEDGGGAGGGGGGYPTGGLGGNVFTGRHGGYSGRSGDSLIPKRFKRSDANNGGKGGATGFESTDGKSGFVTITIPKLTIAGSPGAGGAGSVIGQSGANVLAQTTGTIVTYPTVANLTLGGQGGNVFNTVTAVSSLSGRGGNLGQAGETILAGTAEGGRAGRYLVGNTFVTWSNVGTILGTSI